MRITTSIDIDAPVAAVWGVVGPRFGDVGTWARAVKTSTAVGVPGEPGSGRSCQVAVAGFDALTEELLRYDDATRTLTYRATAGMPGFVRSATSTWRVDSRPGGRSRFTMSADLVLSGWARPLTPAFALYLWGVGLSTARDLRTYAETGRPRRALDGLVRLNAVFCTACGALLLALPGWWASHLGGPPPGVLTGLGAALMAYGITLGLITRRAVSASTGRGVAVLDGVWVVATLALLILAGTTFSRVGLTAVAGTGAVVAVLGVLQWRAAATSLAEAAATVFQHTEAPSGRY